jgi:hypothetical protein
VLYSTPPLRIARIAFTLRPRRPMHMALGERGNALRGGFGNAFRSLVCDASCPGTTSCPRRATCPYACLFEPLWPKAASTLGTLEPGHFSGLRNRVSVTPESRSISSLQIPFDGMDPSHLSSSERAKSQGLLPWLSTAD